jgi:hypothetical protein
MRTKKGEMGGIGRVEGGKSARLGAKEGENKKNENF